MEVGRSAYFLVGEAKLNPDKLVSDNNQGTLTRPPPIWVSMAFGIEPYFLWGILIRYLDLSVSPLTAAYY